MDRFIVLGTHIQDLCLFPLKSNMDRFIDCDPIELPSNRLALKSNMDRFIVS